MTSLQGSAAVGSFGFTEKHSPGQTSKSITTPADSQSGGKLQRKSIGDLNDLVLMWI